MNNPDSLLNAARKVAEITGRPWSAVQPYYKALQGADNDSRDAWLPKSLGRNIWYAHPNYITRLLLALAATTNPAEATATMCWAQELTPSGRKRHLTEEPAANVPIVIESVFFKYLVDAEAAAELLNVEVHPDSKTIIFNLKNGEPVIYRPCYKIGEGKDEPARPFVGIQHRGVIDGLVFVFLAKSINWRRSDQAPLEKVSQGEVSEDD